MPTFEFKSPIGQTYSVQGPDGATPEQAFGILQQHLGNSPTPQGIATNALDFAKSIPRGLATGISSALSATGKAESVDMLMPDGTPMAETMPTPDQVVSQIEKATGPLYKPQGMAGRFGESVGETFGNPVSYVGPGSLPLKVGGAVLSALGGQASEETGLPGGRLVGSVVGGVAGGRVFGPKAPEAAIPTAPELKSAAKAGYDSAAASGLAVKPEAVSQFAAQAQQDLIKNGFAPEIAGKTFKLLDTLQNAPTGATTTAANLGTLRSYLGRITQETQPANGGMVKPTPDAAAASLVAGSFKNFVENIPENSVLAGNAKAFATATREANANYAAAQRVGNFDARLTRAENATDRQVAGSLDNQIKSKAGQMLDNPKNLRGLTQDEINQLQLINSGTFVSNVLRQLGRGGAGVIPLMTQATTAIPLATATGGASIIPQMALAAGLYGARRASEAITKGRAQDFADMLAKRSPLYQSRVNALPPVDTMSMPSQLLRGGLLGIR